MNNAGKKSLRRGLSAGGGLVIVLAIAFSLGLEFPGFPLNGLLGAFLFVLVGVVLFIARTYVKDRKMLFTSLGFFGPHGLTKMVDVGPNDITPTHIRYRTPDGEEHKVKHFHPFAIPNEDGYDLVYLTPENTVEALNPARLFRKYAQKLSEDGKKAVMELYGKMLQQFPEAEALDPNRLTIEETENDDPDRMNQELAGIVADIKRGWQEKLGLRQNWFLIMAGAVIGIMIITFVYMGAGVDFHGLTAH